MGSGVLIGAVLSALFCCMPLGIVAVVYAWQASAKQASGDQGGAMEAARLATLWTWASVLLGGLFGIAYVVATVALELV